MRINHLIYGKGPAIVLLHGWGFNSNIWQPLVPSLAKHYEIHLIDLPGFGNTDFMSWQDFKNLLIQQLPAKFALLGWSLGGLYATRLAIEFQDKVSHLINVASAPRFVADVNWPAIPPENLDKFYYGLERDPNATLRDFVKLNGPSHIDRNSRHSERNPRHSERNPRHIERNPRHSECNPSHIERNPRDSERNPRHSECNEESPVIQEIPPPACAWGRDDVYSAQEIPPGREDLFNALKNGLEVLQQWDLRNDIKSLIMPVCYLFARLDAVLPASIMPVMQTNYPNFKYMMFKRSAHLLFLSEPDLFINEIQNIIS